MEDPNTETPSESADASTIHQFSLTELLPPERIRLDVRAGGWQEAVRDAGKLLFETDAVRFEYIDAMIKVAQELGPYIVIAPGIALPHAATEAGAKHTALSLIKLAQPVYFGNADNDPVRLVFGLAAIDNKAHIMALQALAEIFTSKELMEQLFHADTVDAVMELMQRAEQMVLRK